MGPEVVYEDERRWLLLGLMPDTTGEQIESVQRIVQFYVPTEIGSLRYRCSYDAHTGAHTYTETHKAPKEYSKGPEHEAKIPAWVYDMMRPNTIGETIKTRTTLAVDGWSFELDEFHNDCQGLIIVELEFKAPKDMAEELVAELHAEYMALKLPDIFGPNYEITGDASYSNQQLATKGMPE